MRNTLLESVEPAQPAHRIVIKYTPSIQNYFAIFYTNHDGRRIAQFVRHNTALELMDEDDACVICPKCDMPFGSMQVFKLHYKFNHMRKDN
jgi:hypothetical protein